MHTYVDILQFHYFRPGRKVTLYIDVSVRTYISQSLHARITWIFSITSQAHKHMYALSLHLKST